jgi:hypothetical protein
MKGDVKRARARRQEQVSKVVWGLMFVTVGTLFLLHETGRIDLGQGGKPGLRPAFAVDGEESTRWSSAFRDPQSITVDLGAAAAIKKVVLKWEGSYGKDYEILVSEDGTRWTTAAQVKDGDGAVDELPMDAQGRYVRMAGTRRGSPWGYSLYELQVYGPEGALLSRDKPVTASSVEGGDLYPWIRFWPLLMVAAGLPLVLAPRDDGNLVFGVLLTGAGAYWQLHNFDLVQWSFGQAAAVLFIVVGLLILLQSLRRDGADTPPDAGAETPGSAQ